MENWKEIKDYEGYYEISDYGNIRSVAHKVKTKCGAYRKSPGRMLIQKTTAKGYKQAHLSKGGEAKWFLVHRLVAMAFVPNPNNFPQVNHKDEDKMNNRYDNLEWVTPSDNCKYGHRNDNIIARTRKCVSQFSLDGTFLRTFKTLNGAARETKIGASHICCVCKGKRDQAGGYKWEYA